MCIFIFSEILANVPISFVQLFQLRGTGQTPDICEKNTGNGRGFIMWKKHWLLEYVYLSMKSY